MISADELLAALNTLRAYMQERESREPKPVLPVHLKPAERKPAACPEREFLEWFQAEYRRRRHGADYYVSWGRDMALVKKLLCATSADRLRRCAQIMLSDRCEDDWIQRSDRSIVALSTKFNWLSDRLAAWEAPDAKKLGERA